MLLPRYSLANNSKKYEEHDYQYSNGEPIVIETNMSRDDPMLSDNDDPRSQSNFSKNYPILTLSTGPCFDREDNNNNNNS